MKYLALKGAISDELADKLANRPVAVVKQLSQETPDEGR